MRTERPADHHGVFFVGDTPQELRQLALSVACSAERGRIHRKPAARAGRACNAMRSTAEGGHGRQDGWAKRSKAATPISSAAVSARAILPTRATRRAFRTAAARLRRTIHTCAPCRAALVTTQFCTTLFGAACGKITKRKTHAQRQTANLYRTRYFRCGSFSAMAEAAPSLLAEFSA